jgi:hypothetical protein
MPTTHDPMTTDDDGRPIEPATPLPPREADDTRRRISLNLLKTEWASIDLLCRVKGWSISQCIVRSANIAARIYTATDPAAIWEGRLAPDEIPLPGWLELHEPQRGNRPTIVTRLEIL